VITGYAFAVSLCVLVVGLLFGLLRTRRIREKYAGIWIVVSVGVLVLAVFPRFAFWLAKLVGVSTPVNLLFAVSIAVLLTVCIQLSIETSALEEETRTIAEELALLRLEVRAVRDAGAGGPGPSTHPGAVHSGAVHPGAVHPGAAEATAVHPAAAAYPVAAYPTPVEPIPVQPAAGQPAAAYPSAVYPAAHPVSIPDTRAALPSD